MVPIKLDGKQVYGVVTFDGVGVRVRVTVDEFDQLGRVTGTQVQFESMGRSDKFLLTAAEQLPPFAFLRLLPLSSCVAG
jgi:hypothetical protein